MSAALYNTTILRLAASIPHHARLADPHATAERRSPVCGSRVTVDVMLGEDGCVAEIGQLVRACALGQASASLMGAHAIGRSPAELTATRDALAAFLAGTRDDPGDWPGLDIFAPARPHSARHASIRLAFEAVAEAAERAATRDTTSGTTAAA
ncbi:iron-sulfur cluster assembly scaffold protein [Sphingomonas naphthae]|uniref:Iron-sulfur cluster assembly scaffold protein n=1 Tax=Sphingomonas naphthae TaxID=1813468 RepID=A0ABY7TFG4_9SPHN|nr:iron-sulfur cluster assembly scaffold protein [Sphingomonas naphthae]WCT71977.1 iron-sulfur cluster assembly scaffold protein [Sphingomonas naphthae]